MLPAVTIDPEAIYHEGNLALALDIAPATLARARRDGRLRYSRQGRRVLLLGQWVIDWLKTEASGISRRECEEATVDA
jgi:hypothetical protein